MTYIADLDIGRAQLLRAKLLETHDDGEFQRLTFAGLKNQRPSKVGRNLPFGFSSHAPVGAVGHMLAVGGRPDQMWALGFEHPDHRPRNLALGCTILYNAHGDAVSLVEHEIRVVTQTLKIFADVEISGNITQTGNFTQTGVHVDNNGPHTA